MKSPDMLSMTRFKHCPSCGRTNIKAHDEKSMICPDCGYLFYYNMASAAGCLLEIPQGLLMIIRNHDPKKGMLDVPGGFADYGESLEETATRETLEELNLNVTNLEYFGSFPNEYHYRDVHYPTLDVFFKAHCADLSRLRANDEVTETAYLTRETFSEEAIGFVSVKAALRKYFALRLHQ